MTRPSERKRLGWWRKGVYLLSFAGNKYNRRRRSRPPEVENKRQSEVERHNLHVLQAEFQVRTSEASVEVKSEGARTMTKKKNKSKSN